MADQQYPTKVNEFAYEGRLFGLKPVAYSQDGNPRCEAAMSVNRKFGDEWESVWFDVVAFGEMADQLARCQDKDEVVVKGRMSVSRGFTNKEGVDFPARFSLVVKELERVGAFEPAGAASNPAVDDSDIPF